jgi:hypothetical protein
MAKAGWDVLTKCAHCELAMRTDLALIARISGPNASLWNRRARCRRMLCPGFVEFYARAPGMSGHEPLRADDREPAREPFVNRQARSKSG